MTKDVNQVQVLTRAVSLLRLLAANNRTGMRLVDILRVSDIERSTAHRLLQNMVSEKMVFQDFETKRYFLGMAIYEMGVAVPALNLRDICQPFLQHIAQTTGDTVFLTVRSGFDGICVDRKEGSFPIAYVQEAGRRRPLTVGASNLAILSKLDEQEIVRIRAENRLRVSKTYPLYSEQEITRRLREGKKHGYIFTDVLERVGIKALAMCITDAKGGPIAAISLSALNMRWTEKKLDDTCLVLRQAIEDIKQTLAHKRSSSFIG